MNELPDENSPNIIEDHNFGGIGSRKLEEVNLSFRSSEASKEEAKNG